MSTITTSTQRSRLHMPVLRLACAWISEKRSCAQMCFLQSLTYGSSASLVNLAYMFCTHASTYARARLLGSSADAILPFGVTKC